MPGAVAATGEPALPDPGLTARLRDELGGAARPAIVASLDVLHQSGVAESPRYADRVDAADMQTATLLARAEAVGIDDRRCSDRRRERIWRAGR